MLFVQPDKEERPKIERTVPVVNFITNCPRSVKAARYVNGLGQYYEREIGRLSSEKIVGTILAVEKAIKTSYSENFDLYPFTHGMGVCVKEVDGTIHLISPKMKKSGKYEVVERPVGKYIKVLEPLMNPEEVSETAKKLICMCKDKNANEVRGAFHEAIESEIQELEIKYPGLFEGSPPYTLKKSVFSTMPFYHIPQFIEPDFLSVLLMRILNCSKVSSLLPKISEEIKNDWATLDGFLNEVLHPVATEVVAGIIKIIVYLSIHNHGARFLKSLESYGFTLKKPNSSLFKDIEEALIFLGLRRWQICLTRVPFYSKKEARDPREYINWYKALRMSALNAGFEIDSAFTFYEMGEFK